MTELVALTEHFDRTLQQEKTQKTNKLMPLQLQQLQGPGQRDQRNLLVLILNHNQEVLVQALYPKMSGCVANNQGTGKGIAQFYIHLPVGLPLGPRLSPQEGFQETSKYSPVNCSP